MKFLEIRLLWLAGMITIGSLTGCSITKFAVNKVFSEPSDEQASPSVLETEDHPEMVRHTLPPLIKSLEAILVEVPDNPYLAMNYAQGLLFFASSFIEFDADQLEYDDYQRSQILRGRATRMYTRAHEALLDGFALLYPDAATAIESDPAWVARQVSYEDRNWLYWMAVAYGLKIAAGSNNAHVFAQLPIPEQFMKHLLKIDPDYGDGAVHEFMFRFTLAMGSGPGAVEAALEHYQQSQRLGGDIKLAPKVAFAEKMLVQDQNREEFVRVLEQVLEFDLDSAPQQRIFNVLAQERARWLLDHVDDLFI